MINIHSFPLLVHYGLCILVRYQQSCLTAGSLTIALSHFHNLHGSFLFESSSNYTEGIGSDPIKKFVDFTVKLATSAMTIEAPPQAKPLAEEDGYWHDWASLFCIRCTCHALKKLGQKRVISMKGLYCYTRSNGAEYLPWKAFVRLSATNWVLTALTCINRNLAKAARSDGMETTTHFSNDSDSENDFLTMIVVN